MPRPSKPRRVREPVQVYLDRADKELLDETAEKTGLSRAEILRRGLRRVADDVLGDKPRGFSFNTLIDSLEGVEDLPRDLAKKHDSYVFNHIGVKGMTIADFKATVDAREAAEEEVVEDDEYLEMILDRVEDDDDDEEDFFEEI